MEKLEWCGYPMVKNFEDIFIRFGATPERDGQTDRQTDGRTPGDGIYRAYAYASRGKKLSERARLPGNSTMLTRRHTTISQEPLHLFIFIAFTVHPPLLFFLLLEAQNQLFFTNYSSHRLRILNFPICLYDLGLL